MLVSRMSDHWQWQLIRNMPTQYFLRANRRENFSFLLPFKWILFGILQTCCLKRDALNSTCKQNNSLFMLIRTWRKKFQSCYSFFDEKQRKQIFGRCISFFSPWNRKKLSRLFLLYVSCLCSKSSKSAWKCGGFFGETPSMLG